MLFNATQSEELRVAIVDGQKLLDLDIETTGKEQRKGNIYKGVVTRVEPSLEAAFVDYGALRHGFLPFKEVSRSYFANPQADPAKVRIQQALKEGQEVLVQVDKDERGNKGAALTTFIGLAGRYLVLMPNNPRGGGVSRRIEGEDRNELRELISQLNISSGMSVIARTAGIGRTAEELDWDLNYLVQLWNAISSASDQQAGSFLIYQESSLVIRSIRDHFHQDIGELLIDTDEIHEQAIQFMSHVMPNNVDRVKKYSDEVPLFSRFQIEHQIESAYSREVMLPSGGAIIIDHTEAIVAIDVNSAKSTRGSDIEETAFKTNLEAAEEITRQLRLRDLGGLVVIDFIDMESSKNQRGVENFLRTSLGNDRARVQVGKISQFGLLELSRQRINSALGETNSITCPQCNGLGTIRSTESTALHILRILQEEAMKENTATIHAQVPVDVATYLLNEKREEFHDLESRLKINCLLIPNTTLNVPHYEITRVRHDDQISTLSDSTPSYRLANNVTDNNYELIKKTKAKDKNAEAIVKGIPTGKPAPVKKKKGMIASLVKLIKTIFGSKKKNKRKSIKSRTKSMKSRRDRRPDRRNDSNKRDLRRREKDSKESRRDRTNDQRRNQRTRKGPQSARDTSTDEQSNEHVEARSRRRRRRGKPSETQDGAIATDNKKQASVDGKYESHVLPTDLPNENNQINDITDRHTRPIQSEESLIDKAEKKEIAAEMNEQDGFSLKETKIAEDPSPGANGALDLKNSLKNEEGREFVETSFDLPSDMEMIETKQKSIESTENAKAPQGKVNHRDLIHENVFPDQAVDKPKQPLVLEQVETKKSEDND